MLVDQAAHEVLSQLNWQKVVSWIEHETFTNVEIGVYEGYKYTLWMDDSQCGEVTVSDDGQCLDLYFQWDIMRPVNAHAHITQFHQ